VDAFAGLVQRWQGVVLSLIALAATLWLAGTGRLGLYIHPRYFVFTTVLAVIAAVLVVVATAVVRPGGHEEHDGHEGHDGRDGGGEALGRSRRGRSALVAVGGSAIVVGALVALLVLPTETLTTATASARQMNTGAIEASEPTGEYADYTVKDWAALLAQGEPEQFFAGRSAAVSGFVTPDEDDPENVFYVARFVVTCCAVDAQPVGVPVHRPGWQQEYAVDSWLEVSGGFATNPSATSAESIVLDPDVLTPIAEPAMPYVY